MRDDVGETAAEIDIAQEPDDAVEQQVLHGDEEGKLGGAVDLNAHRNHGRLHFGDLIAVEEDADATDLAFNEVVDVRAFSTGHHPAGTPGGSDP